MRRLRDSCYPLTGSIVPLLFLWHTEYSTSSHSLRIPYPCAPVHMSHSASPSKDAGRLGPSHPLTPIVNQAKSSQVPGVGGDRGSLWPDWGGVTLCPLMNTSQKRGDSSSWKRSKETGQRSVLLLSTGQPEAILQGRDGA